MIATPTLLLFFLSFTPAIESTGQTETTIRFTGAAVVASCDLAEFSRAAIEVARFLATSDELTTTNALYKSPAAKLREEADWIEHRDATIRAFRDQIERCDWMAEPGAFNREDASGEPKP